MMDLISGIQFLGWNLYNTINTSTYTKKKHTHLYTCRELSVSYFPLHKSPDKSILSKSSWHWMRFHLTLLPGCPRKYFCFIRKNQILCVKMQKNWRSVRGITQANHFEGMLSKVLQWDTSGKQEELCWFVPAILISVLHKEFLMYF